MARLRGCLHSGHVHHRRARQRWRASPSPRSTVQALRRLHRLGEPPAGAEGIHREPLEVAKVTTLQVNRPARIRPCRRGPHAPGAASCSRRRSPDRHHHPVRRGYRCPPARHHVRRFGISSALRRLSLEPRRCHGSPVFAAVLLYLRVLPRCRGVLQDRLVVFRHTRVSG